MAKYYIMVQRSSGGDRWITLEEHKAGSGPIGTQSSEVLTDSLVNDLADSISNVVPTSAPVDVWKQDDFQDI